MISRLKKPLIGGPLVRCRVLDNLSPRAIPSSTADRVAGAIFPHHRVPMLLLDLITHAPRPHGQHNRPVTWRQATLRGPLTTVPLVHMTALVFPGHLATRMFNEGEEGLEMLLLFSLPQRPPSTGPRPGQGQRVAAHLALRQFTSPVKKTIMKRDVSKLRNLKGLSKRLSERTASACFQLVPVLELL